MYTERKLVSEDLEIRIYPKIFQLKLIEALKVPISMRPNKMRHATGSV